MIMLPSMVIRVLLESSFWGRTLHTTFVEVTSFLLYAGTSSYWMIQNVSVSTTRCCLIILSPVPNPWHSLPISLNRVLTNLFGIWDGAGDGGIIGTLLSQFLGLSWLDWQVVVHFACGTWCGVQWADLGDSLWGAPLEVAPVSCVGFAPLELAHTEQVR